MNSLTCLSHIWETQVRVNIFVVRIILNVFHNPVQIGPGVNANTDSARGNLAGTFVNVFVNARFGNDKLMIEAEEGNTRTRITVCGILF